MSDESLKLKIHRVLNPADQSTPTSYASNFLIIGVIVANLIAMALETDTDLAQRFQRQFHFIELFSVCFFTIEYLLRVWSVSAHGSRLAYLYSLSSVIDVLAILPFYIALFFAIDLRVFITLRLFRLFKLFRYFSPLIVMGEVLKAEARSFAAALLVMFILLFVCATGIYFFESAVQPDKLGSIPQAMWWAIVTLTTLGYGDIVPITLGGRIFAGTMTIFAIGVVALPAGMLASRFSEELHKRKIEFREVVSAFNNDGSISIHDESKLLEIQQQLCLSNSDVEKIRTEVLKSTQAAGSCPTCGQQVIQ